MWVLRDKDIKYVQQNAPDVLPMVRSGEENAVPVGKWKEDESDPLKLSKKERLRLLHNDIEDGWCLPTAMAPLRNVWLAVLLCVLNILIPGFGTLLSAWCGDLWETTEVKYNDVVPTEGNADKKGEHDPEDGQNKNEPKPPVISVGRPRDSEISTTVFAGIAQFFTSVCGLGWIWSVSHGCSLVNNAMTY